MMIASFLRLPLRTSLLAIGLLLAAFTLPVPTIANDAKSDGAAKAGADSVAIRQERVVHMMGELEDKFRSLASTLEKTEPEQAKRLITALNKSKEELIQPRLKTIVEKMKTGEFEYTTDVDGKRITRNIMQDQEDIVNSLKALAQLLTEDPSELDEKLREMRELEKFKVEVEKLINRENEHLTESKKAADPDAATKDLDKQIASVAKLIGKQEDVIKKTGAAREKGVHEVNKVTKDQKDVRKETEDAKKDVAGKESQEGKEGTEGGDKPGEAGGKPGEAGGKPGEAGGKPGEAGGKPGEAGGKPGEAGGKPGEAGGQSGGESGGESGPKPPGQEPLEKAIAAQKAAEKDLADGKGKQAEQNEKVALDNLKKALDDLKKERDRIAKLPPEHNDAMAKAQDKTGDDTGDLAKKMAQAKSSSPGGASGQPGSEGGEGGEGGEGAPGTEDVQQAQQQMQQAAKKLGEKDPKSAQKPQKDAVDKLKKAREEIEKRLAQLRKEMQEELLAALEARFREMLNKQKPVTLETASLDGIRKQREWKRAEKLNCAKLGQEEKFIGSLADVALQIIKEDGTTIVFPRIVERLRDDLYAVSERLKAEQTDGYTQDLQLEIERTLQDLIEALQRAQEVSDQSPPPGESPPPGQPQPQPLVPNSAELKLIKNAQLRVNRLTTSFDKNRPSDMGPNDAKAVKDIARRQEDVHQMAEDIVERGSK